MIVTNRVAMLVALVPLGLSACQPHRAKPASDPATLAPDAVVGTVAAPSAPTTGRTDETLPPSSPQEQHALVSGLATSDGRPATARRCRVHLRRDAMGLATVSPLPMNSRSSTPAVRATQLEGVLDTASDHWITLRTTDRVYSLPVGSILAIEYLDDR